MDRPSECIWCGLGLLDDTTHETIYECGTVQHPRSDRWSQSAGCVEIMRSRKRIERAIKALEDANQIMMRLDDDEDVSLVVESQVVSHAIEILEGEEDEDDETD